MVMVLESTCLQSVHCLQSELMHPETETDSMCWIHTFSSVFEHTGVVDVGAGCCHVVAVSTCSAARAAVIMVRSVCGISLSGNMSRGLTSQRRDKR